MPPPDGVPQNGWRARVQRAVRRVVEWTPVAYVVRTLACFWAIACWLSTTFWHIVRTIWRTLVLIVTPATYPRLLLGVASKETYLEPLEGFRFLFFFASLFLFAIMSGQSLPAARLSNSLVLCVYAAIGLLGVQHVRVSMVHLALAVYIFNAETHSYAFWMTGVLILSGLELLCAIFHDALELALQSVERPRAPA